MQCLILTGGLGTRMKSYTERVPKALIPVAGTPFLKYQLDYLASQGVDRVLLSIGYKGEMIREYVRRQPKKELIVDVVDEGQQLLGTAGALRLAFQENKLQEDFLILYGDSFLPIDFTPVWRRFKEGPEPALMTVLKNDEQWDQSNACFDGRRVTLYQKGLKTKPPEMRYIDYGLSAMQRRLVADEIPADAPCDLADIFHRLSVSGRLAGYEANQRFFEIGSPEGLSDFVNYIAKK
jgi:MurNAc alpha-1-phosphate uridylyltransferase